MTAPHPARVIPVRRAESLIPFGEHCYTPWPDHEQPADGARYEITPCPFWRLDPAAAAAHGRQQAGYCAYLRRGDWEDAGPSLLWDQIKACGVRTEEALLAGR